MGKVMTFAVVIIAFALVFTGLSLTGCDDVTDLPELDLTGEISLSNHSPKVGESITATYNLCNGTGEQTWRWFHADETDVLIEGETGPTFTAIAADVGKKIKVQLSFANQIGSLSAITDSEVVTTTANGSNPGDGETDPTSVDSKYTRGTAVSRFLGWQWEETNSGFVWIFKNDGTVTVIHHCDLMFDRQFNYLFYDNVLVTYGSEMDADRIDNTVFTMTDDGLSFTRDNNTNFVRRQAYTDGSSPDLPLVLSNRLQGTWKGKDGMEFKFGADAGLSISSPSGSGKYGYLVRNAEILTLGPLVEGTPPVLQRYTFSRTGTNLSLKRLGGQTYSLVRQP